MIAPEQEDDPVYCCSLKLPISKIVTYLLVLALGFLLGVSVDSIVMRLMGSTESRAYEDRVEQWHRLYEAAGMTGDNRIRMDIVDRLMCSNRSGETIGVIVEVNYYVYCMAPDGAVQELRPQGEYESFNNLITDPRPRRAWHNPEFLSSVQVLRPKGEYVSFYMLIADSHLQWSLHNPEFLSSVSSSDKARFYVQQHRWPH